MTIVQTLYEVHHQTATRPDAMRTRTRVAKV